MPGHPPVSRPADEAPRAGTRQIRRVFEGCDQEFHDDVSLKLGSKMDRRYFGGPMYNRVVLDGGRHTVPLTRKLSGVYYTAQTLKIECINQSAPGTVLVLPADAYQPNELGRLDIAAGSFSWTVLIECPGGADVSVVVGDSLDGVFSVGWGVVPVKLDTSTPDSGDKCRFVVECIVLPPPLNCYSRLIYPA